MYRPACRIIQIGGRSHRSPLIVRTMSGSLSPPPEEDALITLVLVLVDVVPFRLADKEVVEPHRGAHTNAFCVIIIITRTLGKCYSLSLSLSQNDTVYYVRPLVLLFGGRIRATRVCHALALF
tara:strand:- start:3508 stop:3876 length:369 start_codon:yes stop_codon:yes gene_type:complete